MNSVFIQSFIKFNRGVPFVNEKRNEVFSLLLKTGIKHNFQAYLSRYEYYNKRSRKLRKAWTFEEGRWKQVKDKRVNLFYYHGKTRGIVEECKKIQKIINLPTINHLELEQVCDDKLLTYNIFPELSPKTFMVNDFYELQRIIHYVKSKKVVLKPRFGSNGRGIVILDKNKLRNGIKKDTIVQEFVDSSNGVLDIKKTHDLRVIIIDGKINHSYIRVPKYKNLLCNAYLGAKKIFIRNDEIPSSILKRIKKIDSHFQHYGPRIYSTDFAMDENNKPWLIELNSKPGMMYYDKAPQLRLKYFNKVYKSFEGLV
jgi:hypothetical protein